MANTLQPTIRELELIEANKLLSDDIYKNFYPVRCNSCGIENGFNRRIFHITGVPKKKQSDETTQNLLQYHFLHYHKIKYVFFRTYAKKFYVDSANCSSCKSTAIVFDLSYDYAVSLYEKMVGDNVIQLKK